MQIALRYAARTDLGLGPKSRNEDSGYAGQHLLVLADGMGGHAAGDVASSMIVGQLAPLDAEGIGADNALSRLGDTVREANSSLHKAMDDDPQLRGMGSTTIAMLRAGNKLAMAHIGDSRAYLLRDGLLTQMTKDHSFVQQLVDDERITPEQAEDHPQRSLVTRVMTGQETDEPDLSMRELRLGDRYLLCSDGLSDFVRREIIEEILAGGLGPAKTADRLIEVALKASTRDNVTVVVADVVDLDVLDGADVPSSAPQVVGAASLRDREGRRTKGGPVSPAEKAASLVRSVRRSSGQHDDDNDDTDDHGGLALAEESRSAKARWGRRLLVVAVAAVVLVGVGYAAWTWTQRQFFIGDADGYVALYRGVPQDIGPIPLSSVEQTTGVPVSQLPTIYQELVERRIVLNSQTDADARLAVLTQAAVDCRATAARGVPCGGNPVIAPLPSTTTSPEPSGTATTAPTAPSTSTPGATPGATGTITAPPTTARVP